MTAPGIARADAGALFTAGLRARAAAAAGEGAPQWHCGAGVNRCVHFSALFADIEPLTEAGLVGLACTPSHGSPGGGTSAVRHQPHRLRLAAADKPPFIVDMATSAAARRIQLHQRAGKALPEGWGIDSQGQPTTDAAGC